MWKLDRREGYLSREPKKKEDEDVCLAANSVSDAMSLKSGVLTRWLCVFEYDMLLEKITWDASMSISIMLESNEC